mgnify:FL=1
MLQKFVEAGYEAVDFEEKADIYIINTCTVTNISDKKSRQIIRRAKHTNKNAIVAAVGCYAQVAKDKLEDIPEIDLVLGTSEKNNIVKYVEDFFSSKEAIEEVSDVMHQSEFLDFGSVTYTEKTRAVIKIQDGCDRFCSYCIIPYARGRVRSRKIESIVKEVEQITQEGIKEIVITGIHIASYGKDFKDGTSLIDLLEAINQVSDLKRIRLSSIEPTIITEEFMERLIKIDKLCPHFHLSLQSGCTETLKRMNRRYTAEEFEKCTESLRKNYPDCALTTDIIVGFPGETEEEFKQTYKFLSKIKFYQMHVFKYSPREGTKAAVMPNQISPEKKEERSRMLIELSHKNETEYKQKFINKTVEVLFEQPEGDYIIGHTPNYLKVAVKGNMDLENQIKKVQILEDGEEFLIGTIVE